MLGCDFLWQVQYLVMLERHFSWQAQHLVKFSEIAGARYARVSPYKVRLKGEILNLRERAGCGVSVSWLHHARIMLKSPFYSRQHFTDSSIKS